MSGLRNSLKRNLSVMLVLGYDNFVLFPRFFSHHFIVLKQYWGKKKVFLFIALFSSPVGIRVGPDKPGLERTKIRDGLLRFPDLLIISISISKVKDQKLWLAE